jgi:hypothetical protein
MSSCASGRCTASKRRAVDSVGFRRAPARLARTGSRPATASPVLDRRETAGHIASGVFLRAFARGTPRPPPAANSLSAPGSACGWNPLNRNREAGRGNSPAQPGRPSISSPSAARPPDCPVSARDPRQRCPSRTDEKRPSSRLRRRPSCDRSGGAPRMGADYSTMAFSRRALARWRASPRSNARATPAGARGGGATNRSRDCRVAGWPR